MKDYSIGSILAKFIYSLTYKHLPENAIESAIYTGSIDIVLPSTAQTDWDDIEVKVYGGGKELGLRYIGALNIVAGNS